MNKEEMKARSLSLTPNTKVEHEGKKKTLEEWSSDTGVRIGKLKMSFIRTGSLKLALERDAAMKDILQSREERKLKWEQERLSGISRTGKKLKGSEES